MNLPLEATDTRSAESSLWLAIGVAIALVLVVHADTLAAMVQLWFSSGTYAHGALIAPIVAWLLWRNRHAVPVAAEVTPSALWLVGLIALLWAAGRASGILLLEHLALVGFVPALMGMVLGGAWLRANMFPLAYLIFAVPLGEALVEPLMEVTATFTVWAVRASGVPVFRDGMNFSIPSGDFAVVKACSGVRYLVTSIAVGLLYAYVCLRSFRWRLVFMVVALLTPIVANGVRAYGIVMIAHLSDFRFAGGADHIVYGWLFYGLVMAALFYFGSLLQPADERAASVAPAPIRSSSAVAPPRLSWWVWLGLAVGIATLPRLLLGLMSLGDSGVPPTVALPRALHEWNGPLPAVSWLRPDLPPSMARASAHYTREGVVVELHVARSLRQSQGEEIVNSEHRLYDQSAFRVVASAVRPESADGAPALNETQLGSENERYLVWHWYEIAGQSTASPTRAKLITLLGLLRGRHDAAIINVSTRIDDGVEGARGQLGAFLAAHGTVLLACISGSVASDQCSPPDAHASVHDAR